VESKSADPKVRGGTEVMQNRQAVEDLFIDMVKSAEHEVLVIFPTINTFLREQGLGIIQLLKYGVAQRGIVVKILTPINDYVLKIVQGLVEEIGEPAKKNFYVRALVDTNEEPSLNTVTILIVDKRASLAIEKQDDTKENFVDAIVLATYSNSKPTVSSYLYIFQSLWNQVKLYEELKKHDKMQQEFINIAAHELKTPAQSILGYAELAIADPPSEKQIQSFIGVIYRNAFRLQKLTEDILEVARIESQTLALNKIRFNLKDIIQSVLEDVQVKLVSDSRSNKVKVAYETVETKEFGQMGIHSDDIFIEADRDRITQVICNLLDNALKFTAQGLVSVTVGRKKDQTGIDEVNVSVEDTGTGIDPEIFPRLFTKFSSKSFSGTGLGLYISKSIIDAHGGKIWGENNNHGKKSGAKFYFSLPVAPPNRENTNCARLTN
jgi:two-component system sensor histidine kinase VicK